MDAIIASMAPQLVTIAGAILLGLTSWGIAVLRSKCKLEAGKAALDEVDQVVRTVVGNLTQTTVKAAKEAAADGKLTPEEKAGIKMKAIQEIERLTSTEVATAANRIVGDLGDYVTKAIEREVLAAKGNAPPA